MKLIHRKNGFTLIELVIAVAIIGILTAIATFVFMSYREKAALAGCLASAHSIRASLITYASTTRHGSFPAQHEISSWPQLKGICNMNGSDLPEAPLNVGFQNWVNYTAVDTNNDTVIDDFSLCLRVTI